MKQNDYITWQYVLTQQNPGDIGSRGCLIQNCQICGWKARLG